VVSYRGAQGMHGAFPRLENRRRALTRRPGAGCRIIVHEAVEDGRCHTRQPSHAFLKMFGDQLEIFPRLLATDWLAEPIESSVKDNARGIQLVQTRSTIASGYRLLLSQL
jgi:hypothetical protein